MAAYSFIPEIWSKRFIVTLEKTLTAQQITNANYDGDVAEAGDTVHLWKAGAVTIRDYTKNTDMATAEIPAPTEDSFTIAQLKYFHFYVDRVDKVQGLIDPLPHYMNRAIYGVKDTIDQFIIAKRSSFASANQYTPSATLDKTTVWDEFNHMHRLLDDSYVPQSGRWAMVSPRVLEIIRQYLANKTTQLGDQVSINGYMGDFCSFRIYVNHNITDVSEDVNATNSGNEVVHYCLFGVNDGITLVKQIPEGDMKLYEPELRFGSAVKGLTLYDAHVLDSGVYNGYMKAWWTS